MPAGFPAGMLSANAMQFFQTKNYLAIVHEFQRMSRIIPLDGRPFRKDIEPTYYGDSVGHWEGDTLVIVSTNFKRWMLDDYFYTDPKEFRMHSDALTTTERLQWKDKDTISYLLTIDDPKIFTKPWSQEFQIKAKPEWDKTGLFEYVCEENNRCPGGKCQGKFSLPQGYRQQFQAGDLHLVAVDFARDFNTHIVVFFRSLNQR